jgi:hypothetical protein
VSNLFSSSYNIFSYARDESDKSQFLGLML